MESQILRSEEKSRRDNSTIFSPNISNLRSITMEDQIQKARDTKQSGSNGRKLMVVNHGVDGSVTTDSIEMGCSEVGRYTLSEQDIYAMMDSYFESKVAPYKSLTFKLNNEVEELKTQNEIYKASIESLSNEFTSLHNTVENMKQLVLTLSGLITQNMTDKRSRGEGSDVEESIFTEKEEEVPSIVVDENPPHFEGIINFDNVQNEAPQIALTPEMIGEPEQLVVTDRAPTPVIMDQSAKTESHSSTVTTPQVTNIQPVIQPLPQLQVSSPLPIVQQVQPLPALSQVTITPLSIQPVIGNQYTHPNPVIIPKIVPIILAHPK